MFEIWQCQNALCSLRFPAEVGQVLGRNGRLPACPLCGFPLQLCLSYIHARAETTAVAAQHLPLAALLDNIRSLHNVGSMFRSADGAGLSHLYLGGITATPAHPKLAKAALGAHLSVPWSYHANGLATAVALKQQGYALWAIETIPDALPLFHTPIKPSQPTLLIVGNEKAGVDPGLLAECDHIFSLPMLGEKRSLNAAVAFGIAVYFLRVATA